MISVLLSNNVVAEKLTKLYKTKRQMCGDLFQGYMIQVFMMVRENARQLSGDGDFLDLNVMGKAYIFHRADVQSQFVPS